MTTNTEKAHWSERARGFGQKLTEFIAEHGTHVGMTGGAALALAGTATLVSAGFAPTAAEVEAAQSASTAMYIGSFLKFALGAVSEFVANHKLGGYEHLFDSNTQRPMTDPMSSKRGASPIDDALLQSPDFRAAMLAVTQHLQDEPTTRAGITELLRNHPGARQVLVELHKESMQLSPQNQTQDLRNDEQDLDGPSMG